MDTLQMQVNTLMRLCTARNEEERTVLREDLRRLMVLEQPKERNPEKVIRQILLELGAPDHLVGHPYMIQAILLVVENRTYIQNITFGLYPQVAAHFDTTAARVERALRHLIEVTWSRGDWEVLGRYFGNTISQDRGKPTNGEFVARIANVVRQRLEEAA